jgi:hypothetical protein
MMGGLVTEWDARDFKKLFPRLYREIMRRDMALSVDSVRTDPEEGEKEAQRLPAGYEPTPIDYLRRCSNDEEALEVIKYLEERGEIDGKLSEELREQVRSLGVRSFGPLKEEGYYLRKYGCRPIR